MKYPSDKGTLLSNSFPEELKYLLTLEGNTEAELHLVRDRTTRIPDTYQQGMTGTFSRKNVIYSQVQLFSFLFPFEYAVILARSRLREITVYCLPESSRMRSGIEYVQVLDKIQAILPMTKVCHSH